MIRRQLALSSASLALSHFLVKILDMVALVVTARLLTPDDFGLVAIAASVLLITNAMTELPVINALVQKDQMEADDLPSAFLMTVLRGLVIGLALIALSWVIPAWFGDERLRPILWVLAIAPVLQGFASPRMVFFMRDVNYLPTAILAFVAKLFAFSATIAIAIMTSSYWALVFGMVAAPALTGLLTYFVAPWRPSFSTAAIGSIFNFAGWVTIAKTIHTFSLQSDRFFIGLILGKSSLGQYTIGSDISSLATYTFAQPLSEPLFSAFSRMKSDKAKLANAYLRGQQILVAAILPLGIGVSLLAERLVALLLGNGWDQVVPVMQWLAPAVGAQLIIVPLQSAILALGKSRTLAIREAVAILIRLPITIFAAWSFGFVAAVIARSLTSFLVILVNLQIARSALGLGITKQIFGCWRSIASALVMACVLHIIQSYLPISIDAWERIANLAILVVTGGVVYACSHLILWRISGMPDGVEKLLENAIANILKRKDHHEK